MLCLDKPEDVTLFGNINAAKAQFLEISVDRCDPQVEECESEKDIDEMIDKLMIVYSYNT